MDDTERAVRGPAGGQASTTLTGDLLDHVRALLRAAWREIAASGATIDGINGPTRHALPAIVLAVAAVEAFLNEAFLAEAAGDDVPAARGLEVVPREWLETSDLAGKLHAVPFLAVGTALARSDHRYRDMHALIALRDVLVRRTPRLRPKVVRDLVERGIAMRDDGPWTRSVATSETIRWAHNAACETVRALVALMPDPLRRAWDGRAAAFRPIGDQAARRTLLTARPQGDGATRAPVAPIDTERGA